MDNLKRSINGDHLDNTISSPEPKRSKPSSSKSHSTEDKGDQDKDYYYDCDNYDTDMDSDDNKKDSEFCKKRKALKSALQSESYNTALLLFRNDAALPEKFKLEDVDESTDGQIFKMFLQKRNDLHSSIVNKDDIKLEDLAKESKFHFNINNESALYTAITSRNFEAYSFLKEHGAEFKSNKEKLKAKQTLNLEEKFEMGKIDSCHSKQIEKPYLKNLALNSKTPEFVSAKPNDSFEKTVEGYYAKLDEIPEISAILKVVNFTEHLKIVFDFKRAHICGICSISESSEDYGLTDYVQGKIFIGAKRNENQVLGTLAHELTHMAMQIVYENRCVPYDSSDKESNEKFDEALWQIEKKLPDWNQHNYIKTLSEDILAKGFGKKYVSNEDAKRCELVARVSQILVEDKDGRNCLRSFNKLYEYYKEVILECEALTDNESVSRVKRQVKHLNESQGKINQVKDLDVIAFKNIEEEFSGFLKTDNFILVLKARNPTLSLLKALYGFYGKKYIKYRNQYFVFEAQRFLSNFESIVNLLESPEAVKLLIIELINLNDDVLSCVVQKVLSIKREIRPMTLKFLFIVGENEVMFQTKLLFEGQYIWNFFDEGFTINDLDDECIEKIMSKQLVFQGKPMRLKNIVTSNENLLNLIGADTIEKLLGKNDLHVGGSVLNAADLEGAYIEELDLEMDFQMLSVGLNLPYHVPCAIFIIHNLLGEDKRNELKKILEKNHVEIGITVGKFWGEKAEIYGKHGDFDKESKAPTDKYILFTDSEITTKDFKNFCKLNPHRKIYYIDTVYEGEKATFFLKMAFIPDFYSSREIRAFKREIDKEVLKKLIKSQSFKTDQFVISSSEEKAVKRFRKGPFSNLEWLDQEIAEKKFKKYTLENKKAHLLQFENDRFLLIDSGGSVKDLRHHFKKPLIHADYSEEYLEEQIKIKNVVLLSDEPGMGKSTTLTNLYERLSENYWFVKINLKDHAKNLKVMNDKKFTQKLIEFLTDSDECLDNDLNKNFLNLAVKSEHFLKPLLIAFDGFDEIGNEKDRKNVITLFKRLKDCKKIKILITTRSNFKEKLEDELCTFAVEFKPFDKKTKLEFIGNYYIERFFFTKYGYRFVAFFPPENRTLIGIYADKLIKKFGDIFKFAKKAEKLIGAPLQLYLILQNSIDSLTRYMDLNDPKADPDFEFLGKNLLDTYKNFVDMKYDLYFKKAGKTNKAEKVVFKKYFEDFHKNLAESLALNLDPPRVLNEEIEHECKVLVQSTGILSQGENLEFVHFTFRDYYTAMVFVQYIQEKRTKEIDFDLVGFLLKEIFLKPENQLVRNFVNLFLEQIPTEKLGKVLSREMGNAIGLIWGRSPSTIFMKRTPLKLAKTENNEHILKFLLYCCNQVFQINDLDLPDDEMDLPNDDANDDVFPSWISL